MNDPTYIQCYLLTETVTKQIRTTSHGKRFQYGHYSCDVNTSNCSDFDNMIGRGG